MPNRAVTVDQASMPRKRDRCVAAYKPQKSKARLENKEPPLNSTCPDICSRCVAAWVGLVIPGETVPLFSLIYALSNLCSLSPSLCLCLFLFLVSVSVGWLVIVCQKQQICVAAPRQWQHDRESVCSPRHGPTDTGDAADSEVRDQPKWLRVGCVSNWVRLLSAWLL